MQPEGTKQLLSAVEALLAADFDQDQVLEAFARAVDAAIESGDEALMTRAIEQGSRVASACGGWHRSWVHYCVSNAWSGLRGLRLGGRSPLSWDQPELLNTILELRRAIFIDGFQQMHFLRRATVLCNLGNAVRDAGRVVEAIEHWEAALHANPFHAMARGNLGIGLEFYARCLYDPGHQVCLLQRARYHLNLAVETGLGRDGATYPEALDGFAEYLEFVDGVLQRCGASTETDDEWLNSFKLGKSKKEKLYRQWCLERKLFLNPMNDVFVEPIAAHDVLGLPDHRADGVGIKFLAFFNQMKQEYIYARWALHEGMSARGLHYADRNVRLVFNADFARYSVATEQVKTAFRAAYSLLDKVAYFVHDYWQLKTEKTGVNFNSLWTVQVEAAIEEPPRETGGRNKGKEKRKTVRIVRPEFEQSENLFLQALFWISRDVFREAFQQVASPDTQALHDLRNHLEHKFLKVVEFRRCEGDESIYVDTLSHEVTLDELTMKAERMLKKARSSLIYLCLAMHQAELKRPSDGLIVLPSPTMDFPDSLKR